MYKKSVINSTTTFIQKRQALILVCRVVAGSVDVVVVGAVTFVGSVTAVVVVVALANVVVTFVGMIVVTVVAVALGNDVVILVEVWRVVVVVAVVTATNTINIKQNKPYV